MNNIKIFEQKYNKLASAMTVPYRVQKTRLVIVDWSKTLCSLYQARSFMSDS